MLLVKRSISRFIPRVRQQAERQTSCALIFQFSLYQIEGQTRATIASRIFRSRRNTKQYWELRRRLNCRDHVQELCQRVWKLLCRGFSRWNCLANENRVLKGVASLSCVSHTLYFSATGSTDLKAKIIVNRVGRLQYYIVLNQNSRIVSQDQKFTWCKRLTFRFVSFKHLNC